jgi:hypothetical protein
MDMRVLVVALCGLVVMSCAAVPARVAPSPASPTIAPSIAAAPIAATPSAEPSLEATASPAPTPDAVPIVLPDCPGPARRPAPPRPIRRLCPDGAEVDVDTTLSENDMAAIVAQVSGDLAAVQAEFAWTLRARALIHVLADRDAYVDGLETYFGYSATTAEFVADNSVAFFEPSTREIAVDWDAIRDRRPIAALRHELTHVVTLEACAPRCDLVPAWLNEGQARLAEALIPGSDWRLMRVRYEASSMVTTDNLLPLTALWTQAQWNAYADWLGYYKYQEAARATELLRQDIGENAIARLYQRMRRGEDVPSAYAALSGKTFASFTRGLADRIQEAVPAARGIATVTPGAEGGVSYLLYGFPPEAHVTLRLHSHRIDEMQTVDVSPQGALFGSIDATYPQGIYTITATVGDASVSATVVKRGGRLGIQ